MPRRTACKLTGLTALPDLLQIFRPVIRQLVAQILRCTRRILAAVLFPSRSFVAEHLGSADRVDLLDLVFSGSLFVVHASLIEQTTGRDRHPERSEGSLASQSEILLRLRRHIRSR